MLQRQRRWRRSWYDSLGRWRWFFCRDLMRFVLPLRGLRGNIQQSSKEERGAENRNPTHMEPYPDFTPETSGKKCINP